MVESRTVRRPSSVRAGRAVAVVAGARDMAMKPVSAVKVLGTLLPACAGASTPRLPSCTPPACRRRSPASMFPRDGRPEPVVSGYSSPVSPVSPSRQVSSARLSRPRSRGLPTPLRNRWRPTRIAAPSPSRTPPMPVSREMSARTPPASGPREDQRKQGSASVVGAYMLATTFNKSDCHLQESLQPCNWECASDSLEFQHVPARRESGARVKPVPSVTVSLTEDTSATGLSARAAPEVHAVTVSLADEMNVHRGGGAQCYPLSPEGSLYSGTVCDSEFGLADWQLTQPCLNDGIDVRPGMPAKVPSSQQWEDAVAYIMQLEKQKGLLQRRVAQAASLGVTRASRTLVSVVFHAWSLLKTKSGDIGH